jgi:pimeloyl-ACP methyl ester carboxylesterase
MSEQGWIRPPKLALALHASASSSKQWRPLEQRLGGAVRLIAPDHIGHGAAQPWFGHAHPSLSDHAAQFGSLIESAPKGMHLIGHSFGGVVALQLALNHPTRVRSLVLYEPVLLSLLADLPDLTADENEVNRVADQVRACVARGDREHAAQIFMTYWGGCEAWGRFDVRQRTAVVERIDTVAGHFDVIQGAHELARRLSSISAPTLLLSGGRSTVSARRVARLLAARLPRVRFEAIADAGHMGPVTHANEVNDRVAAFLSATTTGERQADAHVPNSLASSQSFLSSTEPPRRES